jgi:hypothetical protein
VGSARRKSLGKSVAGAVGSLLTTLLIFGAIPAVLVTVVGYPLGGGLGHQWGDGARVALTLVALVAWVAWFACCVQLTRSVVVQVRRGHVSATVDALLTDRVAARIAAGVLSLIAVAAPLFVTSEAGASSTGTAPSTIGMDAPRSIPSPAAAVQPLLTPTTTTATTIEGEQPAASLQPPASVPASLQPAIAISYVVRPGDSLWSIAETQLGDGGDWPALAALNLGRTMPDGLRFVDPSLIQAGWILHLPAEASPVVAPTAAASPAPAPVVIASAAAGPTPKPGQSGLSADAAQAQQFGHDLRAGPTFPAQTAMVAPTSNSLGVTSRGGLSLPELSALGIGALACAALTRRSRRMRMLRQRDGDEPEAASAYAAAVIDADIRLARFSGVPSLHAFEAANYRLGLAMQAMDHDRPLTLGTIRAVCVGAAGVDFWLSEAGQPAPGGFSLSPDGKVWRAAHDVFTPQAGARPFLPIVLPIGEDHDGTWMVPLSRADCLPLVGEGSADLWRAARHAQEAWAWADLVLVTEDPQVVAREVALLDDDESPDDVQVLFFGDPASLSDAQRLKVAIVTGFVAAPSDVTVLVDRNAASIHPLGRTVHPYLMHAETSALVDRLVTAPLRVDSAQPHEGEHADATRRVAPDLRRAETEPAIPLSLAEDHDPAPRVVPPMRVAVSLPDAGTVEVRLLTSTPRLEGLREELPPNRARRATELVAYLALHMDDEVTSDRLRTRVLGSSDADAASKTLFNIAAAARRAMGSDAQGTPLFPAGTRSGIYRVGSAVTVDVHMAAAVAAEGSATEDPGEAMALLRFALNLVEGEPLSNVLSGYGWWEAEGHGARTAAVLVNAAGNLAALAAKAGDFELAQWGLGQARLVDPYSEALSRVAMQVAATAGDADRLRREWRECRRRMDELDPGSSPSARTERLYGELAQRVLVGVTGTPRRH